PPGARMRLGRPIDHPFELYRGLAFSPDGTCVAATHRNEDGWGDVWDAQTGRLVRTLHEKLRRTCKVAFGPDARTLATCSHDQTFILWDLTTGERIFKYGRDYFTVTPGPAFLASSLDGRTLACSIQYARRINGIPLWETASGRMRAELFDLPEGASPRPI